MTRTEMHALIATFPNVFRVKGEPDTPSESPSETLSRGRVERSPSTWSSRAGAATAPRRPRSFGSASTPAR